MISRRSLLAGSAGAGALIASEDVTATSRQTDDTRYLTEMISELREIRRAVSIEGTQAIALVRGAQRTYLKNSGRFPEFIDVGYDVFQSAMDWLIAVRQPVTINRLPDGRYTVALFASTIVLRPDFPDNYVGQGYDR
jgi:hypothetical protein